MGERVHLASKDVGMETAVQDVLNVVKYNELDDFVLVGHSFAGKVVAPVADREPERVRKILYLDAFRPRKVRAPQGSFDPTEFASLAPDQWELPFSEKFLDMIGKDVKDPDREWMLSKATPWLKRHWSEPVVLSEKFDSVRSAYILCTGGGDSVDEVVEGKWGKLEGPYKIIDSGHWPMITKPEELAEDLISLSD